MIQGLIESFGTADATLTLDDGRTVSGRVITTRGPGPFEAALLDGTPIHRMGNFAPGVRKVELRASGPAGETSTATIRIDRRNGITTLEIGITIRD